MIIDMRIYTTRPGQMADFLALYQEHGWGLQIKHLGRCLGFYTTVEGPLNQVIHLWAYDSLSDRDARRTALAADPAWVAYLKQSREFGALVTQENRFLKPTAFSPT
jgi:hypothetical protein